MQLRGLAWGRTRSPALSLQQLLAITRKSRTSFYEHLSLLRQEGVLDWHKEGSRGLVLIFMDGDGQSDAPRVAPADAQLQRYGDWEQECTGDWEDASPEPVGTESPPPAGPHMDTGPHAAFLLDGVVSWDDTAELTGRLDQGCERSENPEASEEEDESEKMASTESENLESPDSQNQASSVSEKPDWAESENPDSTESQKRASIESENLDSVNPDHVFNINPHQDQDQEPEQNLIILINHDPDQEEKPNSLISSELKPLNSHMDSRGCGGEREPEGERGVAEIRNPGTGIIQCDQSDPVQLYQSLVDLEPSPVHATLIRLRVTDLNTWRRSIEHHLEHGWNPANVPIMLEVYRRGGPTGCFVCAKAKLPRRERFPPLTLLGG